MFWHFNIFSNAMALVVAVTYLIVSYFGGGIADLISTGMFLLLPLGCIFHSEALGEYTGFLGRGNITKKSPGFIVRFMGWVMLLMPVIVWLTSGHSLMSTK
jgi:hypothetical protein